MLLYVNPLSIMFAYFFKFRLENLFNHLATAPSVDTNISFIFEENNQLFHQAKYDINQYSFLPGFGQFCLVTSPSNVK